MAVPLTVFIDTSVFRAAQFYFKGRQFTALLGAVPAGEKLTLLIPEPTAGEMNRQMAASAKEAVHALKQAKREHAVLHTVLELPGDATAEEDLERKIASKLRTAWSAFKGRFETKELGYEGVDLREIMRWYFLQKPPFGPGDKRKEFPDALAFVAVRDYAAKQGTQVAVVSHDKDLLRAAEDAPNLFPFAQVAELTNLLLKQADRFNDAERIAGELLGQIAEKIKVQFPELGFDHERDPNGHGAVENVEVAIVDLSPDDLTIVGLGHRRFDVQFTANVHYFADVSYDDPDSWVSGDPGDEVFYLHTCEGRVADEAQISGSARITVSENWRSAALAALEVDEATIEVTTEAPQKDDRDDADDPPDEPGSSG